MKRRFRSLLGLAACVFLFLPGFVCFYDFLKYTADHGGGVPCVPCRTADGAPALNDHGVVTRVDEIVYQRATAKLHRSVVVLGIGGLAVALVVFAECYRCRRRAGRRCPNGGESK